MKTTTAKIKDLKVNPGNPRIIKDDKFRKLVKSIQDFPEMLKIRPIVVNADMVILGGNMRLRACQEAGLKEVPIIRAEDLTEEQQEEIIINEKTYMIPPTVHQLIEGMNQQLSDTAEMYLEMQKLDVFLREHYPEQVAAFMVEHPNQEDRSMIDLVIDILLNRKKLILLR